MTIEQVIQWLCWLIVLGVVWYISLKFKRIKQSHNYLKRLDFYVINTKQSIEILQLVMYIFPINPQIQPLGNITH